MPKSALAAITSAVEAIRVSASMVFFSVSSTSTAGTAYTAIMASSMMIETRMKSLRAPEHFERRGAAGLRRQRALHDASRRRAPGHGLDAAVEDGGDEVAAEARRGGQ